MTHRTDFSFLLFSLFVLNFLVFVPEEATSQEEVELLVAVSSTGSGDRAITSPDTTTWTTRAIQDHTWVDIAFSEALGDFLAIGANGWTARSSDALSWESTQIAGLGQETSNEVGVTFGAGLWVVTGDEFGASTDCSECLATSPDGITWTTRDAGANDLRMYDVHWNGTAFLAVGKDNIQRTTTSSDGITWSAQLADASNFDGSNTKLAFGNDVWVQVSDSSASNRLRYSTDGGSTWIGVGGTSSIIFQDIIFGGGRFVAVSSANQIWRSIDGINWNSEVVSGSWQGVTWVGALGLYVAVETGVAGSGSDVITSPDGVTWTDVGTLGTENQVQKVTHGFSPVCEQGEDCVFTKERPAPLLDVRTSFNPEPEIITREGQTDTVASDGTVYRYDEDGVLQQSSVPCLGGSGEAAPTTQGKGLAVTTDDRVIASCLIASGGQFDTRFKTLALLSLSLQDSTNGVGGGEAGSIDAFNRNRVSAPMTNDLFRIIDPFNDRGSLGFNVGLRLGGGSIDYRTGLVAAIGDERLQIFPGGSESVENIVPIFDAPQLDGTMVALNSTHVWRTDNTGLFLNTWDEEDGFTEVDFNSSFPIPFFNEDEGIRLSKDYDYLLHWTSNTVSVIHSENLTLITQDTTTSDIMGCDIDLFNNYVWCADLTVGLYRFEVFTSVPTAFGINKTGNYTDPSNQTFINATIGLFDTEAQQETPNPLAPPPINLPGAEGGFAEGAEGDEFFGVELLPIASGLGTSLTAIKWLVGIILVVITVGGLVSIKDRGYMAAIGVVLGLIWAAAMGFFPRWVLFIMLMGFAAVGGFVLSRFAGD